MFSEETVRKLLYDAVELARRTSPDNMCEGAIIQKVMREQFTNGKWGSSLEQDDCPACAARSRSQQPRSELIETEFPLAIEFWD